MEVEALDITELPFSDLLLRLAAGEPPPTAALGQGLLAVSGVPRAASLWRRLLPLARRLALLDHAPRAQLLKKHGLGSDVPLKKLDRNVSSLALLLRYSGEPQLLQPVNNLGSVEDGFGNVEERSYVHRFQEFNDDDFESLGELFKELGLCMMELGILVARAYDIAIGGNDLEQSIMDFGSAKARLIHYHSELDNLILKETGGKRKGSMKKERNKPHPSNSQGSPSSHNSCIKSVQARVSRISLSNLWQQWHYDYGILTVLTAPLFLASTLGEGSSISKECPFPDGHTHLQLFDRKKNKIFSARCPPDSFIVLVGEAAAVLSRGKLRSTLHAVSRPLGLANISRETFVVFLQPAWDRTLSYSGYSLEDEEETTTNEKLPFGNGSNGSCGDQDMLMEEILRKIPPLSSRLKDGMTFAEFSRVTTRQYYGGRGTQQNN